MAEKTRNNNTMTESAYMSMIRSVLRRGFRYWKPLQACKTASRLPYTGDNKQQKWTYRCNKCGEWFMGKEVQVDHIYPVGSLKSLDDLADFVENLTAEGFNGDGSSNYQTLCKPCHKVKTKRERDERAAM
jgi:5-methylcytosine-specific restriction endonuclease McrA